MSDIKNGLESQSVAQSSSAAKKRSKRKHKKKKKSSSVVKGPTPAISDEIRRTNALDYLRQWDTDRQLWSFKKKLQYWLLNNMYDKKQVSQTDYNVYSLSIIITVCEIKLAYHLREWSLYDTRLQLYMY